MSENDEIIPVEKSVGNGNAHIFYCAFHESRRYYGTCCHLIESAKAGRLEGDEQSCSSAIRRGEGVCEALRMRREELEKGQAIYFVERLGTPDRPRVPATERSTRTLGGSASYQRGWARVGGEAQASRPPAPMPKPAASRPAAKSADDILDVNYGDAINKAIASSSIPVEDKSQLSNNKFEQMRDIARRQFKDDPTRLEATLKKIDFAEQQTVKQKGVA
jgi:hypothetical protein